MNTRDLTNTMVAWDALVDDTKRIALFPWPDYRALSDDYLLTWGACELDVRSVSFDNRKSLLCDYYFRWIMQDGFSAIELHHALLPIAEYRALIPNDVLYDPMLAA